VLNEISGSTEGSKLVTLRAYRQGQFFKSIRPRLVQPNRAKADVRLFKLEDSTPGDSMGGLDQCRPTRV
jgi:hypothetical protein